ncbi:FkbM family methyltransferase [Rhodalgimonas zhirmunskyi]|uniref:FkbM family methyltransferase n=1 Tax=Rhodalgimonas zhirmunskyi TaxID=2964767 RepID=A0AAJ1X688_9RHOB|nr:FkbM family methyltransferase [Rhodoalgimonas zhirmunskyi]MDQ2095256.1 FkbM family methyltransferase [Rhodoalgimonas zhirmunskyi]
MYKIGNHWVPSADARGKRNKAKLQKMYIQHNGSVEPLLMAFEKIREAYPNNEMSTKSAIDCGANVGSYTRELSKVFAKTYSFEPSRDTFACLERNVYEWDIYGRTHLYNAAVSDTRGYVGMGRDWGRLSITSRVKGRGDIPAIPLDSLGLNDLGFLKLDVEGFELAALKGATKMIKTSKPVVFMEVKPKEEAKSATPYAAQKYLLELGYEMVAEIGINRLYFPKQAMPHASSSASQ